MSDAFDKWYDVHGYRDLNGIYGLHQVEAITESAWDAGVKYALGNQEYSLGTYAPEDLRPEAYEKGERQVRGTSAPEPGLSFHLWTDGGVAIHDPTGRVAIVHKDDLLAFAEEIKKEI